MYHSIGVVSKNNAKDLPSKTFAEESTEFLNEKSEQLRPWKVFKHHNFVVS